MPASLYLAVISAIRGLSIDQNSVSGRYQAAGAGFCGERHGGDGRDLPLGALRRTGHAVCPVARHGV